MIVVGVADEDDVGVFTLFNFPRIDVNSFVQFQFKSRVAEPRQFVQQAHGHNRLVIFSFFSILPMSTADHRQMN
jgi:hypothetical protein